MTEIVGHWNHYLDVFLPKQRDIYYTEEYVRLYETNTEKAVCFVYTDGDSCFLMPFLRRTFEFDTHVYFDFETAYGYGGPIYNTDDTDFIHDAWQSLIDYAHTHDYVCGFVRFHPLLNNQKCFEDFGQLYYDRKTIAMDLSGGIDATWMNEIHTKNRNVIKKGEKNGLHFIVDEQMEHIADFIKLYNATMDKLNAEDFYYFSDNYYNQLRDTLRNRYLGLVEYEGRFVAGALFFYSLPYGHYHLAGSDQSILNLSPNNYLLWNAAKELASRGVQLFHLGGGTDGNENNSLYLFKRKFSKSEYQFSFGKLLFNPTLYNCICSAWEKKNPDKAIKLKNLLLKYKY